MPQSSCQATTADSSKDIVPLDSDALAEVYSNHKSKIMLSHMLAFQAFLPDLIRHGFIDADELLKEATLTFESEALQGMADDSAEMEDTRQKGMYVTISEEDDGSLTVTSPDDMSREDTMALLEKVVDLHRFLTFVIDTIMSNKQTRNSFRKAVKQIISEAAAPDADCQV